MPDFIPQSSHFGFLDTLREPVLVLDEGLCVVAANRAFERGFQVNTSETVGQPVEALGSGQWRIPRLLDLLARIVPDDSTFDDFEVEHDFEHIGRRTMLLNARKVRWPGFEVRMVLLAFEDVTERRAIEAALALRNQELEEFAYTVSHDLKSPLVTITGRIGLLRRHLASGETDKVVGAIERIERSADRMGRIIGDLLELSRAGQVSGEAAPVDVAALVATLWEGIAPRTDANVCRIEIDGAMPGVVADEGRLADVFENLLANAVTYACTQGRPTTIRVGAVSTRRELRYFVADDGPGIAPEYHERIFGLFQRLSTQQEGTGIGLALVSKIMRAFGGRAWVESEVGQGATFWLAFPASARAAASASDAAPADPL